MGGYFLMGVSYEVLWGFMGFMGFYGVMGFVLGEVIS